MKTIVMMILLVAGCAGVDAQDATSEQGLICGQYCDPAALIGAATSYGESLFFDAVATGGQACTTSDGDTSCSAGFLTCQLPCAGGARCCQYIAWCTATQCGWYQ